MNLCKVVEGFPTIQIMNFIFIIATVVLFIFIAIKVIKKTQTLPLRLLFILLLIPTYIFGVLIIGVIFLVSTDQIGDDNPPSAQFHVLNAAVKNTCFLDSNRIHCPKSAQEIVAIEADHFSKLTENAHLTYQYYSQTNQYTLVVRNNDWHYNNDRAVIFDPRLVNLGNYSNGLDYADVQIADNCNGTFRIVNPPAIPGPWNKIN